MKKRRVYRERNGQMRVVEKWVRRIDWALRELLPGKTDEQFVVYTRADFETHYHGAIRISKTLLLALASTGRESALGQHIQKKRNVVMSFPTIQSESTV